MCVTHAHTNTGSSSWWLSTYYSLMEHFGNRDHLYIPHVIDWFRLRWQIDISQISSQFRDGEMGSSSRDFFFPLSQDFPDSPQFTQGAAARFMRIFKGRTEWHDGNSGWGAGNSVARSYTGSGCSLSYTINLLKMLRQLNKIKRIQMWKKIIVIGYSRTWDPGIMFL